MRCLVGLEETRPPEGPAGLSGLWLDPAWTRAGCSRPPGQTSTRCGTHLERQEGQGVLDQQPHQPLGVEDELVSAGLLVPKVGGKRVTRRRSLREAEGCLGRWSRVGKEGEFTALQCGLEQVPSPVLASIHPSRSQDRPALVCRGQTPHSPRSVLGVGSIPSPGDSRTLGRIAEPQFPLGSPACRCQQLARGWTAAPEVSPPSPRGRGSPDDGVHAPHLRGALQHTEGPRERVALVGRSQRCPGSQHKVGAR